MNISKTCEARFAFNTKGNRCCLEISQEEQTPNLGKIEVTDRHPVLFKIEIVS